MNRKVSLTLSLLIAMMALSACTAQEKEIVKEIPTVAKADFSEIEKLPVQTEESRIEWSGERKLMKVRHFGTVNLQEGFIALKEGVPVGGEFVIDMTTISDEDLPEERRGGLEKHLKSADFFDVENHPTATLHIAKVESGKAIGILTIKGIEGGIEFPFEYTFEKGVFEATAKMAVDRTLYDVRFGSGKFFSDVGDKVIEDQMNFEVSLKAGN